MHLLAMYDISDVKIQTKARKILKKYLHNIQFSVFEGDLNPSQYLKLKNEIKEISKKLGENEGIIIFELPLNSKVKKIIFGGKGDLPTNII